MTIRRQLLNFGNRTTDVRFGLGALNELPKLFAGAVGKPRLACMIYGASVDAAHVETAERALIDAGYTMARREVNDAASHAFTDVVSLLAWLQEVGLTSEDLLVGLGDADVCSLASMCARLWLGRVTCALVPTTLDAMMTCATAMEPFAVGGEDEPASAASPFGAISLVPEPALVVCDLDLVLNAPIQERGMGLVRMVAAYLTDSRRSWQALPDLIPGIVNGGEISLLEALGTTFTSRLNTVKSVSPAARMAFQYGETAAAALRACLGVGYAPYLLLAEGMRFEARVAVDVFDFSVDAVFDQDDYLEDLGIEELQFDLDPAVFLDALERERFRRANRFQLVLPKNLGIIRPASVDRAVLERHARAFLDSRR